MTRRDQTLRAWIDRPSRSDNWQSNVSHKGKVHTLSTRSRIRKAALQFNTLHIIAKLTGKPMTPPATHVQPDLFAEN